jgi:hypothetical protein
LRRALLLGVASFGAAAEPAPAPRHLEVSSTIERSVTADSAATGPAELVVSVKFINTTEHVIDSIRITSPVPAGAAYVPQSASGPGSEVLFSYDGGKTFGKPDELVIAGADGNALRVEAAEYTHVRFVLRAPLDTGASGVARFRAVQR